MLLMFENREIAVLAYNTETLLAEKLETVIARGTANIETFARKTVEKIYNICYNINVDIYVKRAMEE